MRFGIDVCILGGLADPGRVVELAQEAEAAGWQALFVWDHLAFAWEAPSADPWVVLSAVAQATGRLRLGTAVTPLPRRRPAVLANTVATLDRLSGGRVTLGAGLGGVPGEYSAFGEPAGVPERAARLDEALEVVTALWSGARVRHEGRYYRVNGVRLAPLPLQRPRVPVWIGGDSPGARRLAARWDGWIIGADDERGRMATPPEQIASGVADVRARRKRDRTASEPPREQDRSVSEPPSRTIDQPQGSTIDQPQGSTIDQPSRTVRQPPSRTGPEPCPPDADQPYGSDEWAPAGPAGTFDVAMTGVSAGPEDPVCAGYAAAGVTWWLEHIHEHRAPYPELLARVRAGPPARQAGR